MCAELTAVGGSWRHAEPQRSVPFVWSPAYLTVYGLTAPETPCYGPPYLAAASSVSLADLSPAAPLSCSTAGGGRGGNSSSPLAEGQELSAGGGWDGSSGEMDGAGWEGMTNTSSSSSSCSNAGGVSCRADSEMRRWVVPWGEGVSGSEEVLLCVGRDCHLWENFSPAAGGGITALE